MTDLYRTPSIPATELIADRVVSGLPPGTSPWWIARLLGLMEARRDRLERLRCYYRGEQDTWRLHSQAAREAFGRTFTGLKANLAAPIVEASASRLRVEGFRIPLDGGTSRRDDPEAWRIWQANGMDSRSAIAHSEAIVMGECPVIVDRDPEDDRTPRITVEDPLQVVVERDPANPRRRLAALKHWKDPDGTRRLILYLPERVEWWIGRPGSAGGYRGVSDASFDLRGANWTLLPELSGAPPVPGTVPVVLLVNKSRVDGTGQGEHEHVLPLLDAINKELLDLLTTSEFAAFPLRYAMGVSLDREPDAPPENEDGTEQVDSLGRPRRSEAPIVSAINRWLTAEDPEASVGQLPAADLGPYTAAIDKLVELVGTVSTTPYHLMLNAPTSVPASGEALKSAERSLDSKVDRAQVDFGEAWEEVMRLAFLTIGDLQRASTRSETRWQPAQSASEAQHTDALVKLQQIGVDLETLLELVPMSSEQIARVLARREQEPPRSADLIEQVKAGILTENEARAALKRDPIAWSDDLSTDEIASMIAQVKEGLLTVEEARKVLGRPAIEWPEDLSEKVAQAKELIGAGFDPEDVLARLGLPPIRHTGLPPTSVQKPADAAAVPAATDQAVQP